MSCVFAVKQLAHRAISWCLAYYKIAYVSAGRPWASWWKVKACFMRHECTLIYRYLYHIPTKILLSGCKSKIINLIVTMHRNNMPISNGKCIFWYIERLWRNAGWSLMAIRQWIRWQMAGLSSSHGVYIATWRHQWPTALLLSVCLHATVK